VGQSLQYFFQQLLNGLSIGSIYAMIAVGYSMVYSILYMINFAHGDIYIFGTFIAFALWKAGLPIPAVVVLACLAGALVGLVVERTVYRPVRFANRIVPMITALGVAMVLRTISQVIWGAETLPFLQLIPNTTISIGGLRIFSQQVLVVGTSLVCMVAFTLIIEKTKLGKATQCIMQDINLSRIMGIQVDTIIPLIYGLGGFMGVVGGILFASYYNAISINLGLLGTLKAWAAAMLGGVGSFYSPFLGGLILGVAEAMAGAYLGPAYKDAVGYLVIVAVLLFRPTGLFGKPRIEKV